MDSGNCNSMRFSSYIAGAGDPFFISPPPPPPPPPPSAAPRTSKKRSRPSRRAPTTVLSTDTSNFRAMVQVFTGIPSPPLQLPPRSFSLNFPPPLLLPRPISSPKVPPPSSIPACHQTPINANRISTTLFQSVPPFASPDQALLTDASEEVDGGFGGESVRLASWICYSD